MKVAVVGLGKLGLPVACCFSQKHTVFGIDTNRNVVSQVTAGVCPWDEPGLAELVAQRRVLATDYFGAVSGADIIVVIVPTPSLADDRFSNEYLLDVFDQMAPFLRPGQTVVVSSTVMPTTCSQVLAPALASYEDVGLIYSPEFIALGSVISDFKHPDFVLLGSRTGDFADLHAARYEALVRSVVGPEPPVRHMTWIDAEITKISINTYLSVKIAYANLLAQIADKVGGDVEAITQTVGLDSRIGKKFLKAGLPAGGTCLPRDVRAFARLLRDVRIIPKLPDAIQDHNRAWIDALLSLILEYARNGKKVGVLGIAYKPNTPITEESFGLEIANELANVCPVFVYDSRAVATGKVSQTLTAKACIDLADVVVICTQEEEFQTVDLQGKPTIDIWGIRPEPWVIRPGGRTVKP